MFTVVESVSGAAQSFRRILDPVDKIQDEGSMTLLRRSTITAHSWSIQPCRASSESGQSRSWRAKQPEQMRMVSFSHR